MSQFLVPLRDFLFPLCHHYTTKLFVKFLKNIFFQDQISVYWYNCCKNIEKRGVTILSVSLV